MWIRSTSAYDIGPTPPSTGSATARIGASSWSASSAEPVNPNRSARLTVPRSGGGTSSTGGSRSRATDVVASSGRVGAHVPNARSTGSTASPVKNSAPPTNRGTGTRSNSIAVTMPKLP